MKYEVCESDSFYYAQGVYWNNISSNQKDEKHLQWNTNRGQDTLVIESNYGFEINEEKLKLLCDSLSVCEKPLTSFVEIQLGIRVWYMSASDKSKNNGCPIQSARSYCVFPCSRENNVVKIYLHADMKNRSSYVLDIPLETSVQIFRVTEKGGFLIKKEVDTGFYGITFAPDLVNNYIDGSLSYSIDGFEIPITEKMVQNNTVFVKTYTAPEIISKNEGLIINIY